MGTIVDWQSERSHILLNPALKQADSLRAEQLPKLPGHLWLATSGSSADHDEIKLVALSKQAFLVSAAAVNTHLEVRNQDHWFLALPDFHVGGLSIYARASLSSSKITLWPGIGQKWSPHRFYDDLCASGCTLVSVVPTQIWDLVNLQLRAPDSLRAAIVGGAALSSAVYPRARRLGWPLLPSYGMTECCSQIATAKLASLLANGPPRLQILSHITAKTGDDSKLAVKSPSLLTGVATFNEGKVQFFDPKIDGWYQTQDIVEIADGFLLFRGRNDDFVKINGERVSQLALQNILEKVLTELKRREEACVVTVADPRKGNRVVMAFATQDESLIAAVTKKFNQEVLPHERIKATYPVPYLPRTSLGKVKLNELIRMLT
jgi:O-succinylbenzoic acid--CoA ligase